ncbi:MAG: hypothetical protein U5K27_09990 [Desulfotignum sp.]|nr:hypothetical protein [Desulfotignum sp.]
MISDTFAASGALKDNDLADIAIDLDSDLCVLTASGICARYFQNL